MSHPIVKYNLGVIYVDINLPENRVHVFRPLKEITEETDDSEEIYEKAAREHYMSRPRTDEYEKMTLPKYISEYNHTMPKMCQNMLSVLNMKHLTTWLCTKEPNL